MGAGHAHGHAHAGRERPVTPLAVRRALAATVGALVVAALVGLVVLWPSGDAQVDTAALDFGDRARATVTAVGTGGCSYDPAADCVTVSFDVASGPTAGDSSLVEGSLDQATPLSELDEGDRILVNVVPLEGGETLYSFADFERRTPMVLLGLLFVAAVVALGRLRGLLALAGLGASLLVLFGFIIPALVRGTSPVAVAVTGAVLIAVATLFLAHGVNERTAVALLGTVASLVLTAALAVGFAGATRLTGLATEESINLFAFAPGLDFRGLMLAAIIIGALGVLDDVTVTQTSAVWELHRSDPGADAGVLYGRAISIGRDHIASTVNTLVLAYAAAALPLLILFSQAGQPATTVLTYESIAIEVVQTLVGSIGLVASVPITTALAAWVVTQTTRSGD